MEGKGSEQPLLFPLSLWGVPSRKYKLSSPQKLGDARTVSYLEELDGIFNERQTRLYQYYT